MRLAFLGTSEFAVPALQALLASGHEIAGVYTQPPRAAGRGRVVRSTPVQAAAESHGLLVRTPTHLKDTETQRAFVALNLDATVIAAYGLILPLVMLVAPKRGCFNIHASLLPRWRGASPIQRAILAGDAKTGVTIMAVQQALDAGPILLTEAIPIGVRASVESLEHELAHLGARLIVEALARLEFGNLEPVRQPAEGVTYARKLTREEGRLDWSRPAAELARHVRAFASWPGAYFDHNGHRIKVLAAVAVEGGGTPGAVLDGQLTISCGHGALGLRRLQRAGKRAMSAEEFLRGFDIAPGTVLA